MGTCYNLYQYPGNVCGSKLVVQNVSEELENPNQLCQNRKTDENGEEEPGPDTTALVFDGLCPTITKAEWISKVTDVGSLDEWNSDDTRGDLCYYLDVYEATSTNFSKSSQMMNIYGTCDKSSEEEQFTENDL